MGSAMARFSSPNSNSSRSWAWLVASISVMVFARTDRVASHHQDFTLRISAPESLR